MKNWAGNQDFFSDNVVAPRDLAELQRVVSEAVKIKALGTRHSFNRIADTDGVFVSLEHFQSISEPVGGTVRVGGGVKYGQLTCFLEDRGLALHNLASLPHISVAGACATATHGSGRYNGNLSTAVRSMKMVLADGSIRKFEGDELELAAIHLGALGVVYELELATEPSFLVHQWVYQDLPFKAVRNNLDAISTAGYSVSLFTQWQEENFTQFWVKDRTDYEHSDEYFEAKLACQKLHPLTEMDPINCTEQLGESGAWCDRLPHFKMEFTPSAGEELQSEYFVSYDHAVQAMEALFAMGDEITPLLFVSEIRFVAADDLRNSPAFGEEIVGLHFTWRPMWDEVREMLPKIEKALEPFHARPHWGKLFTMPPERLRQVYPRLDELAVLANQLDGDGKFRNEFLKCYF